MSEYSLEIHATVAQLPIVAENLSPDENELASVIYNSSSTEDVSDKIRDLIEKCIMAINQKTNPKKIMWSTNRKITSIIIRWWQNNKLISLWDDEWKFNLTEI